MKAINFNDGWFYKHLDSDEAAIPAALPHDAMRKEARSADSPGGINTGWYAGRDYLYTKTFDIPQDYKNKKIIFEFEGVYHNAEVILNGKKSGLPPLRVQQFLCGHRGVVKRWPFQ